MIITQQDIDDLTEFYEHHQRDFEQRVNVSRELETYTTTTDYFLKLLANVSLEPESYPTDYFADHPHLLFPLGYDDYRAIPFQDDASAQEKIAHLGLLDEFVTDRLCMPYEPFFRKTASGEWFWFEGITHYKIQDESKTTDRGYPYYLHFVGSNSRHFFPTIHHLFRMLERARQSPDPHPHSLLLPGIWTPRVQLHQKLLLQEAAKELIKQIYLQQKELRAFHWRELEEIVAELLSSKGLEIFITPRSKDGGRDVIARGDLIPGEPTIIAVEVKQKHAVGLHDVQRALKANEDFPSLLVATAGVFSAGVIAEKLRQRHQLRLILKDGVALGQWIQAYGAQKGWGRRA